MTSFTSRSRLWGKVWKHDTTRLKERFFSNNPKITGLPRSFLTPILLCRSRGGHALQPSAALFAGRCHQGHSAGRAAGAHGAHPPGEGALGERPHGSGGEAERTQTRGCHLFSLPSFIFYWFYLLPLIFFSFVSSRLVHLVVSSHLIRSDLISSHLLSHLAASRLISSRFVPSQNVKTDREPHIRETRKGKHIGSTASRPTISSPELPPLAATRDSELGRMLEQSGGSVKKKRYVFSCGAKRPKRDINAPN